MSTNKNLLTINVETNNKDEKGRILGYCAKINQWQNSQDKDFYVIVFKTRNGNSFSATQPRKKFDNFDNAKLYAEKTIEERVKKII